ncbi:hypothetical protein IC614_01275 [Allosphingosinicella flava]|uniref:Copper chaperone PCu(A)C n=1 Tax=Allosphingosinicella flava TaxID=2771430 RepID=A0A7T2GK01_9SPHN|nr:hypothetical protein [Sphingosinicella flava]QPQ55279.1 hypothetical protein IC614_01275 [Sphingosinicella flava]
MKRRFFILALASLASACSWNTDVQKAWIRLPPAPGAPGAAYFDVTAESGGTRVLGLEGPFDAARMLDGEGRAIAVLPLSSGEKGRFLPGGPHFAIDGLSPELRPGAALELRLVEDSGTGPRAVTTFSARLVGANEPPPYRD